MFFVWDHVNWRAPITSVADPWATLAAVGKVDKKVIAKQVSG